MTRKCSNFFSTWMKYTEGLPCPEIYREFSGLGLISAALSRRVWMPPTNPALDPAVPNLYLMLVGPPGVGKDVAINPGAKIMEAAIEAAKPTNIGHIGGESISHKGLVDKIADPASKQAVTYKNGESKTFEIYSVTFFLPELGTAMPDYDPRLIPFLNHLWSNRPSYTDTIRGGMTRAENPHLTLIMGNQADTLATIFTEKNFRMGLTARIIFVFSDEIQHIEPYPEEASKYQKYPHLFDDLVNDFVELSKMAGPYKPTKETQRAINDFSLSRPNPVPGSKFSNWNTRRPLHAQKLALCCAAATSSKRELCLDHWQQALELMFKAERQMPRLFEGVVTDKGYSDVYEKLQNLADRAEGGIITRHTIQLHLSRTYSPLEVPNIIKELEAADILKKVRDEDGVEIRPLQYRVVT